MKASIVSLGCPRNLVDSELITGSLKEHGLEIIAIDEKPDILVINTCSFVKSAREESIDAILEAAELKRKGRIKHLVICGCLPQLYRDRLLKELPEADLIVGTSDFVRIKDLVKDVVSGKRISAVSGKLDFLYEASSSRYLLTPPHYAYVKISEGCDNLCSYCIISRLRGRQRSRRIESVVEEVKRLSTSGKLKEVDIIGQDTTAFGVDRYGRQRLAELLRKLCRLKNSVNWIRVLYTHPSHYTDDLIRTVKEEDRISKYLDLPIQHISDKILKRMNRGTTKKNIETLIEKLRKRIPRLALRTSVIVGFPGENDRDFKELADFVREAKFERLGAFIYSRESGTKAAKLPRQVPEKVKIARFDEIMRLQKAVSEELNRSLLGKTVEVLIDEEREDGSGRFLGRTYADAPEVDGSVYVAGKDIRAGEMRNVRITDTLEYDLVGEGI
jgi:ribosomal protein S12 methylthiotransferase